MCLVHSIILATSSNYLADNISVMLISDLSLNIILVFICFNDTVPKAKA